MGGPSGGKIFSNGKGYLFPKHSIIKKTAPISSSKNPPAYKAALLAPEVKPVEHNPPPSYANSMKQN